MQPTFIILAYASGQLLCEAFDRRSAELSAEWFRASGVPCVVRAAA